MHEITFKMLNGTQSSHLTKVFTVMEDTEFWENELAEIVSKDKAVNAIQTIIHMYDDEIINIALDNSEVIDWLQALRVELPYNNYFYFYSNGGIEIIMNDGVEDTLEFLYNYDNLEELNIKYMDSEMEDGEMCLRILSKHMRFNLYQIAKRWEKSHQPSPSKIIKIINMNYKIHNTYGRYERLLNIYEGKETNLQELIEETLRVSTDNNPDMLLNIPKQKEENNLPDDYIWGGATIEEIEAHPERYSGRYDQISYKGVYYWRQM